MEYRLRIFQANWRTKMIEVNIKRCNGVPYITYGIAECTYSNCMKRRRKCFHYCIEHHRLICLEDRSQDHVGEFKMLIQSILCFFLHKKCYGNCQVPHPTAIGHFDHRTILPFCLKCQKYKYGVQYYAK